MAENSAGFSKFEKIMQPLIKLSQFKIVRAVMAAGMATIPFTIVGSLLLVITAIPQAFPGVQAFFDSSILRVEDLFMLANKATMGSLALYFCLVVGFELAKIKRDEEGLNIDPLNGALLSMFALLMCIPELVLSNGRTVLVESVTDSETVINGWRIDGSISRLGSSGIFTGIIMAVIAVSLYGLCIKKNWVIKMPDAVPPGVSKSFTALIPTALIALVVLVINGLLVMAGTDIFDVIYIPFQFVTGLTNTWLGVVVIYLLISALWIVGIHGATIIGAFLTPMSLANLTANVGGAHIPFAGEFQNNYVFIGGSGATLGLCIIMILFSKSEQLKILGKASIVPGLFNINEPLMFGIPIVYNPYMAVPFFLAPVTTASLAYFAIKLQIVKPMIAAVPWPTPGGIGAFVGSGGDWKAAVLALLCVVVAGFIYLPFIKMYDNKLVKEEKDRAEQLEAKKVEA